MAPIIPYSATNTHAIGRNLLRFKSGDSSNTIMDAFNIPTPRR
ncbi:hypothetical protein [uncultured Duncaniella sp.]|nr:hypothetical protein [uncultured Duncaniella sp.]